MLSSLIEWFDAIPFHVVLLTAPLLILIELTVKMLKYKESLKYWILINFWEVFGLVFPTLWLLRNGSESIHFSLIALLVAFFGFYKPIQYGKLRSK